MAEGQLEDLTLAVGLACNTSFYLVVIVSDCSEGAKRLIQGALVESRYVYQNLINLPCFLQAEFTVHNVLYIIESLLNPEYAEKNEETRYDGTFMCTVAKKMHTGICSSGTSSYNCY